jgi:hypothetical protein
MCFRPVHLQGAAQTRHCCKVDSNTSLRKSYIRCTGAGRLLHRR